MPPFSEAVYEKIEILFPAQDRPAARKLIEEKCGADLPLSDDAFGPDPSRFDRIRFAVLKLSGGDIAKLEREIEGANIDWRDTLLDAGFGDVDAHLRCNPKHVRE